MEHAERNNTVRIGLGTKALVVLTLVIVSTAFIGGWVYNRLLARYSLDSQVDQADRLTAAVALAAAGPLGRDDRASLANLAEKLVDHPDVLYISIVDAKQNELAYASNVPEGRYIPRHSRHDPTELSSIQTAGGDCVLVSRPAVEQSGGEPQQVVGAVRLAMDMRRSLDRMGRANLTMLVVGCALVLLAVPVADVMITRVLIRPIRCLVRATRRLAQGDLTARAMTGRTDEVGLLAGSFNEMAEQIQAHHAALRHANERLEIEVARRTAELHVANQRLRQQIEENEEFVRAVSHDLNAPLRNIAGLTTMLIMKSGPQLPEPVLSRLERIRANAESETEMISELLELSRIRSCPQRRAAVDVGKLIEQIRASLEYDLKAKDIVLEVPEGLPTLLVERNRLRQVFMNLIDNAIKYMPDRPDKRIDLAYRRSGGEHIFTVADNGQGIAEEDQRKIFTVFRRASAAKAGVEGKGVGLATVRTIVQSHDGRIWVQSELGKGSTFFIALPVATTEIKGADEGPGQEAPSEAAAPCESKA